jgi:hypothetical protein
VNRHLTGPLSGLSCALAVEVLGQSIFARSPTGTTHDMVHFAAIAFGLVAWVAAAVSQRRGVRRGAPEHPLASIAVGWAAAVLSGVIALMMGYIALLIAIRAGAPIFAPG